MENYPPNKPLLYLLTTGIGENLFAMPVIEHLSKTSENVFVCNDRNYNLFKYYKWLNLVCIPHLYRKDKRAEMNKELERIIHLYNLKSCVSHIDKTLDLYDLSIPKIKLHKENKELCYRAYYCINHGIKDEEKLYPPVDPVKDGIKRIVVYMGSRETLRQLDSNIYRALVNKIVDKFKDYKIYCLVDLKRYPKDFINNVSIIDDTNIDSIIDVFKKGVDVFVGPDSGITGLSIMYNISQVWLESRAKPENVFFSNYLKNKVLVFRHPAPSCEKNCLGRSETGLYDTYTPFDQLSCRKQNIAPCLNLDDACISSIISLIEKSLSL